MLTVMDIWSLFSQTVSNLNYSANSQYYSTLNEINNIQAHSVDSSDMGAYNLTMYGTNTIHDIQSLIVSNISDLKGLAEQSPAAPGTASPVPASALSLANINPAGSLADAVGNISPAHNLLTVLLLVIIGIAIVELIFNKK